MQKIQVIDSHTEGEPTRVVIAGAPDLGPGTAAQRLHVLRTEHDALRSGVCNEPRGFDALVGALLLPPQDATALAQVIFFNNVGYLGMCVHGTIGVAETLRYQGRITPGRSYRLETPVAPVSIEVQPDGSVAVVNVESYRHAHQVRVQSPRVGTIVGDVAWGGNWFFLMAEHGQELSPRRLNALTDYCWEVRQTLQAEGVRGADGGEIDHIELFGPPARSDADSKNFVLCPGREYDRSPCGTGTSAKLACLAADRKLAPGQIWRQESIIGSLFSGSVEPTARGVIPTVAGRAFITAESTLCFATDDPFRQGIRL